MDGARQPRWIRASLCAAIAIAAWRLAATGGASPAPDEHPSFAASAAFFGDQRTYPSGISLDALRIAYAEFLNSRTTEPPSPDTAWRSLGPSNVAGRVLAVAVNESRPTELWVGTATGGLWSLIDSGSSYHWRPIETGYPTQSVGAIFIDSTNRNLIFIGTGELYSTFSAGTPGTSVRTLRGCYGTGMYRSSDNGTTWSPCLTFPDTTITAVTKILSNPRTSRIMYAATTQGIYKSYDEGRTWHMKFQQSMVMDLAINGLDTTRLFAACGDQDAFAPGIYRSTDAGESWEPMNVVPIFTGRASVAINPTNPAIVYAGISDRFGVQGLYRSTDAGTTWSLRDTANYTQYQGWYANVVTANPFFSDEVWCGGIALWTSQNGGFGLKRIEPLDHYHVDIHAITYQRSDPSLRTFYLGTDGGVFKSTDAGLTFHAMNDGFVSAQFYDGIANSPDGLALAVGGIQDNGTWKYTGTPMWQSLQGGDGSWCVIAPSNPQIVLGQYVIIPPANPANTGVQVFRSTNGGPNTQPVFADTTGPVSFTTPIVAAPVNHTMYLGTSAVYKSTDDGASWFSPAKRMLDPFVTGANSCIALAVSHHSADTIYAATAPITHRPGVYASFDGGASWNAIGSALPNRYPTHLAVDGSNARIAYITYSGFGGNHLFRTEDAGTTWQDLTNDLPDVPANCVLPDPMDSGILYVGNDLGVFVSTDGGGDWKPFTNGMPPVIVTAITITEHTRLLRVATHGRGVFERAAISPRVGIVNGSRPLSHSMSITPTVARGDRQIDVRIEPASSDRSEKLQIFDNAGRHVASVQSVVGRSEWRIDTRAMAAGVYTITSHNGRQALSGRFTVVR